MQRAILTSKQARDARTNLGLSQGAVVAELDQNPSFRSYLSQFESGKRLLADNQLRALREFYEGRGYNFQESPESDCTVQVMDGFVIPDGLEAEEADDLLTEYAENRQRLKELLARPVKRGFLFGGVDEDACDESKLEALRLMARNFMLIEQLQGREAILPPSSESLPEEEMETVGDFLGVDFTFAAEEETEVAGDE